MKLISENILKFTIPKQQQKENIILKIKIQIRALKRIELSARFRISKINYCFKFQKIKMMY
jgi:hypothetical protein